MMRLVHERLGLTVLVLGLLAVAPGRVEAQGWLLDAYAGVGIPASNTKDFVSSGFSGGIGGGYIFNRYFGLRADIAGEWLKGKTDTGDGIQLPIFPEQPANFPDLRLYHYDASIMVTLTDLRTTSWLFAFDIGAGATTFQFSGEDAPDNKTKFTVPAGVSVGYLVSDQVGLFVRGRWYLIFTGENDFNKSTWSTFPIWLGIGIRAG